MKNKDLIGDREMYKIYKEILKLTIGRSAKKFGDPFGMGQYHINS